MSNIAFDPTLIAAEAVLVAAGLDPTPVADCHDDTCQWCGPATLPVAA